MNTTNEKKRIVRKLGCKTIDFVGKTKSNPYTDKKLAKEIIDVVAHPRYIPQNWNGKVDSYCKERKWVESKYDKNECKSSSIPLLDMVVDSRTNTIQKQWVLGRVSSLKQYYNCSKFFYALDNDDWDSLYQLNDLFVYCSQNSTENVFPIRIVADKKKGLKSRNKKTGVLRYDKLITIPHLLNQYKKIVIFSRELCQIAKYFNMYIYQSNDYQYLYFASKHSPKQLRNELKKYNLQEVNIV